MKNAGTILMYNCSGPEFSRLRQIFAMLRLRMRVVEPDRYQEWDTLQLYEELCKERESVAAEQA